MDIVDFHAHILPGADHGSASISESLCQISMAKQRGVSRIVATPHFYPSRDTVESFLKRRDGSYDILSSNLSEDAPDVRLGAEVLICDNLEKMPMLTELCIRGSNILLLELPFNDFDKRMVTSVKRLISMGIEVVLAHADRYQPDNINRLVSEGAKIQLNASSLCTLVKSKILYKWMEEGYVVALGSDIHGTDPKAYKNFATAIKKIGPYSKYIKEASDKMWCNFS